MFLKQEFYAETFACAFQWCYCSHENQFWENGNRSSEGIYSWVAL